MSGFLDYLDDFDQRQHKVIQQKVVVSESPLIKENPKVLCMNIEIRTVEGAQKVIEKLQEWISKQEQKESFVLKETEQPKKDYKIPPKKVFENLVQKSRSRAIDILEGLPDDTVITEATLQTNINNMRQPQVLNQRMETVAEHASSLL